MSIYNAQITLSGVSLNVRKITPRQVQNTRKEVIGKSLIQKRIIGLNDQQWELSIEGDIRGDLSTNRAVLESMDNVTSHPYVDGLHNSNYFMVPGTLSFDDSATITPTHFKYSFKLVEE